MLLRRLAVSLLACSLVAMRARAQSPSDDPFLWLEDVYGAKSMAWVEAHNASTLAELQAYPAYDTIYARTLRILNSNARIPYPEIRGAFYYNFWTDSAHPRGIWRRTAPASYLSGTPKWETVLDIDSLSAAEKQTWAWKGADCLPPDQRLCLLALSRGGGDAVETREFSTATKRFVAGGFFLPEAKGGGTWKDANTLFISTDFGAGSMTTSGYPRIVKEWKRGTPLAEAAVVYEGKAADVSVGAAMTRVNGARVPVIYEGVTFFKTELRVMDAGKLRLLDIPLDADFYTLGSQMLLYLRSDTKLGEHTYPQGALVSIDYRRFLAGDRAFRAIVTPDSQTTIESVALTKTQVIVKLLSNVRSELHRYRFANGAWMGERVPTPALGDASVQESSDLTDEFFFTFQSFLQPTSLYAVNAKGASSAVAQLPAMFDASGFEVRQLQATSKDGTRIPYFIVHRSGMIADGSHATLLSGYGGYQVSELPYYSGIAGANWLERGGVYVLANLRGGGEFGPAWHRAAMKENKQRSYDDFIAVAEDLIARKITSPAHLGIVGGSNGGLLVGAAFTQRPDLFGAVVCAVPLLDMRRFSKIAAGASWIDEYGDPDDPAAWAYISKYSPYQNVFAGRTYPRVLFTTTTHDDRVGPVHARKMVAKMESMGYPVYFFEITEGGHGAGDTPEQQAKTRAVTYAYLWKQLK